MNLDRDFLARIAAEIGFRGEMLEKVAHLLAGEHEIRPELLTEDQELASRIRQQPMLLWRMQRSRKN